MAIVLATRGKGENEKIDASTSAPVTVTELTALKRLELDERHLHDKKELSYNVFYRLLTEYVETMDAKDCYVCTQIPTSAKWTFMLNGLDPVIPGVYYICGHNAYYRLPKGWWGRCYLGIVFPKVYQLDDLSVIPKTSGSHRIQKRETAAAVVGDIFGAMIPSLGVVLNSIKIRKLSTIVDNMLTKFSGAIILMDAELAAERAMTLQNRLALDILLAKDGGVCKMLGARHCCTVLLMFVIDYGLLILIDYSRVMRAPLGQKIHRPKSVRI
ncbi:hypothetical protein NDU88_010870 [Pleurodeles waltl]|uniref:Uncharacterized protein n=1 Tax=Pleurodeles waltl TaxID=8319 RepID=A0AAV7S080_PLEWA|nr:hypothetical protein NDU88_010870 [Pleurodeles waltl]